MSPLEQHNGPGEREAVLPAPTCERSRLSPQLRLGITFGVLFALKWSLPALNLSATIQVLTLLIVATYFVWRFWWSCGTGRRGPILLIAALWAAGALKILLRQ